MDPLAMVRPCPARRVLPNETRVFYCAHPMHHSLDDLVSPEICYVCDLWNKPPPAEFRPVPKVFPSRRTGFCRFLGEQTGLRDCPTCRGSVRVKVFACNHPAHQETIIAECETCPDFENRPEAT